MLTFKRRSNKLPQPGRLALSLLLLLLAFAAGAPGASPAWAGRYHVYSCRTPDGAPIPAEGWKGTETGSGSVVVENCPQGGALLAALQRSPGRAANTSSAT